MVLMAVSGDRDTPVHFVHSVHKKELGSRIVFCGRSGPSSPLRPLNDADDIGWNIANFAVGSGDF